MKKKLLLVLCIMTTVFTVVGCSSNLEKESPNGGGTDTEDAANEDSANGDVKTGLAFITSSGSSIDAVAGTADGFAESDSTIIAVTVDESGKIIDCIIDGVKAKISFSPEGELVTDKATEFKTKNELGSDYGMSKASAIGKEWNEQVQALADYVVGKTVEEVKNIAVTEGKTTEADLVASVTINIGGYIEAIEKAVGNAKVLGAKADDKLGLAITTNMSSSKDATVDEDGLAQAYSTFTAVTTDKEGKITSCIIDAAQVNVNFDTTGTTDYADMVQTKNEIGLDYGMAKASSIGKEWNEQAQAFAEYVVGKTAEEVEGIAVTEGKATDADLVASVTLAIEDFISLVVKATK